MSKLKLGFACLATEGHTANRVEISILQVIHSSKLKKISGLDVKGVLLRSVSASNSSTPPELQSFPLTSSLGGHQNPSQYEFF